MKRTPHALAASMSALVFAMSWLACGPSDLEPGYTQCGSNVCAPGQYCLQAQTGFCENGCTSDANCQEGHVCTDIDDVIGSGTCSESAVDPGNDAGPPPPPPPDPLAACQAACDAFQGCGLPAGEVASCRSDCTSLTADQQIAVGNCREESCDAQPGCLGVDCFADDHCAPGEQCVGYDCL